MGRWVITGEVERCTLLCGEMGHYWGGGEVHTVVWGDGSLLGRWRGTHCCVGRWVITGEVERYTLLCGEMGGGEVRGTYLLIPDSTFILDLDVFIFRSVFQLERTDLLLSTTITQR